MNLFPHKVFWGLGGADATYKGHVTMRSRSHPPRNLFPAHALGLMEALVFT